MESLKEAKTVIVVGGGFAGMQASKTLATDPRLRIQIFDRRNHHLFQPLLYQVAMAGLSPAEISVPIRSELNKFSNVEVYLSEVSEVDTEQRKIKSGFGWHHYDYLILAAGCAQSYFGHTNWQEFAPGLKSLEEAIEIRRRVLWAYEKAESTQDHELKKQLLTFVVVGGGPTGVELAGALGELSRYTLSKDFRNIDPARTRILLIEAGPRILSGFSDRLARKATYSLERLGVQVWTNTRVKKIDSQGVQIDNEIILAKTVLWAAGTQPTQLSFSLNLDKSASGLLRVLPDLSIASYPEVFVVGDMAFFQDDRFRNGLPGIAPVAIQQGKHAALNILNEIQGRSRTSFRYRDKGMLATIGRHRAIARIGPIGLGGFMAWILWLVVHIYYLIGFRNRLFVFLQWAWQYINYRKGARLILRKDWRSEG